MKFTLVFPSNVSEDISIAALFIPCLVWYLGEKELLNPHRDNPHYLPGDLQHLLEHQGLKERIADHGDKVVVIAHANGHGTEAYLKDLTADIEEIGFEPIVIRM